MEGKRDGVRIFLRDILYVCHIMSKTLLNTALYILCKATKTENLLYVFGILKVSKHWKDYFEITLECCF